MLPGKKIAITDILAMLRRRVWLIVIPPLVTVFIALVYSSTLPNLYQANMLIAIVPQRVPDAIVRTTVTLRTEEHLDAIRVQVLSRANLQAMIEDMDLYPVMRTVQPIEDVVDQMRDDLDVGLEPSRRGPRGPEPPHAFHIRFTYTDGATAAKVTQHIGSLFVEQNVRDRGALAEATNEFLANELVAARKRLVAQEERLEAFRQRHGNELPTQLESNMQVIQSKQMQVQSLVESMARDRDRKLVLERLYREASMEPPTVIAAQGQGATGATNQATTAREQLAAARAQLADLERRYTPDHPDVARARRQIAALEPKAAAEEAAARAARNDPDALSAPQTGDPARRESLRQMAAEIESLDRQTAFKENEERRLRTEIAEYQRRVEAVPGLESEWVALSRDYDTTQESYRSLLSKAEAAKLGANLEERQIGEQFRIVDPAGVPIRPVASSRLMINGGGLALGLAFGLGLALFLELRDSSFRSDSDVLDVLALPVLASVPRIIGNAEAEHLVRRRRMLSAVGVICLALAGLVAWSLKLWHSVI